MTDRILITGGSGFVGTNLMQQCLDRGRPVLSLDPLPPRNSRHREHWRKADLLDESSLAEAIREFRPRFVIHLAARTDLEEKERISGYAANTDGVASLLGAIGRCGTVERVIFASSQLVCRIGYVPRSDSDYAPNTLYGESKVLGEKIVRERDGAGVEWCIVRPTTVWGPWCNPPQRKFLELIRKGRYFHVGSGKLRKSYGYVGNICHQLVALMEADKSRILRKTLYLADYEPISLRDWADAFQRELGAPKIATCPLPLAKAAAILGDVIQGMGVKDFPFTSFRLGNILAEYVFDLSGTREIVPGLPFSMEEGVKETVRWLQSSE
ncbi:MAG: NAD-dependent epimerase/dehydratase family protein [Deltaproteobacteria bacterium]|nr:NAD(P)-dependent oxidoreductase [Candidatus Deferrimicrobiaceae bacterium]